MAMERILPSGRVHVMVNLLEDEFRYVSWDGLRWRRTDQWRGVCGTALAVYCNRHAGAP